jgi:DNA-binding response OmpR family regulator
MVGIITDPPGRPGAGQPLDSGRVKRPTTRFSQRQGAEAQAAQFDLLVYFLRHPSEVLTRERLLRNVRGYDFSSADTRTVEVHVRWLRGKIEDNPTTPIRIQTSRGVGYMFAG